MYARSHSHTHTRTQTHTPYHLSVKGVLMRGLCVNSSFRHACPTFSSQWRTLSMYTAVTHTPHTAQTHTQLVYTHTTWTHTYTHSMGTVRIQLSPQHLRGPHSYTQHDCVYSYTCVSVCVCAHVGAWPRGILPQALLCLKTKRGSGTLVVSDFTK